MSRERAARAAAGEQPEYETAELHVPLPERGGFTVDGFARATPCKWLGWTKSAQTGQKRLIRGFTPTEKIVTACKVPGSDFHISTWTLNQVAAGTYHRSKMPSPGDPV